MSNETDLVEFGSNIIHTNPSCDVYKKGTRIILVCFCGEKLYIDDHHTNNYCACYKSGRDGNKTLIIRCYCRSLKISHVR